ncbi:hypothetical protein [Hanstruepera ponticola]|uniref:hypothetical protein n=1 Tax=Hanstruepera ponticola TaxID=2042995 RepID=UPI001968C4FA|nr:hypothetical protein [Hanstruepera ponticola]
MKRYVFLWIPMIFIAIINGSARDLWYVSYLGEQSAHQLSTLTLIFLFGLYFYFVFKKYPISSKTMSYKIGITWMLLTLSFEFGFGYYRGLTLTDILADYNILNGRVWVLIPICLLVAPRLYYAWLNKN